MHSVLFFFNSGHLVVFKYLTLAWGGNNKLDIVNCPAVMMCSMVLQNDTKDAFENTVQLWEYDTYKYDEKYYPGCIHYEDLQSNEKAKNTHHMQQSYNWTT